MPILPRAVRVPGARDKLLLLIDPLLVRRRRQHLRLLTCLLIERRWRQAVLRQLHALSLLPLVVALVVSLLLALVAPEVTAAFLTLLALAALLVSPAPLELSFARDHVQVHIHARVLLLRGLRLLVGARVAAVLIGYGVGVDAFALDRLGDRRPPLLLVALERALARPGQFQLEQPHAVVCRAQARPEESARRPKSQLADAPRKSARRPPAKLGLADGARAARARQQPDVRAQLVVCGEPSAKARLAQHVCRLSAAHRAVGVALTKAEE